MNKKKILIVDDDANIAELISLYLTKECFQCEIAEDGETALKLHDSFQPDLMLLDIMLPGIDGYDVCREIRKNHSTPIIMLSAKGEVFDKVLGLELGADDYIIKPFDSKEMVARVKAVLRRYTPAPGSCSTTAGAPKRYRKHILHRPFHQFVQLLRDLHGQTHRNASKRTGTFIFSCQPPKSSVYKRAAVRPDLGLRVHRRDPYRRCPYQTPERKD